MIHKLIHSTISHDVVRFCRDILDGAEAGDVTGVGVILTLKKGRYIVDCCGEVERDPTLGRGALAALDDCLAEIVRSKQDSETTL